jgi:YD repeat-containing protein
MKIVFILALILVAAGCEKKTAGFSNSDKVVLSATNTAATDTVLDWTVRDRTKGKIVQDANDLHRSQIVFPDGLKLVCVDKVIGAVVTADGKTVLLQYDQQLRLTNIIFPDGTAKQFTY